VDVPQGDFRNGQRVQLQLWDCNGTPSQVFWTPVFYQQTYYSLLGTSLGLCIAWDTSIIDQQVVLRPCDDVPQQRWTLLVSNSSSVDTDAAASTTTETGPRNIIIRSDYTASNNMRSWVYLTYNNTRSMTMDEERQFYTHPVIRTMPPTHHFGLYSFPMVSKLPLWLIMVIFVPKTHWICFNVPPIKW